MIFINLSPTFGTLILVSNSLLFQVYIISSSLIDGFVLATQVFALVNQEMKLEQAMWL